MQPAVPPPPPVRSSRGRSVLLSAAAAAAAFLIGFLPQSIQNRSLRESLNATELELRLANVHRRLGVAGLAARQGDFPAAEAAARTFFDESAKLANTHPFTEDARTRVALLGYASQRDAIMGLIAAGDPGAAERLAGLYITMDGVLERRAANATPD